MLSVGTQIGGYRIEGVLGHGGMGVVYEARQLSLNRPVALKLLAPQLGIDPSFRERFKHEGRIQAAIDHPHIVTVYEAGELDDGLYLVMRLIKGPTLKDLIIGRELEAARTLRILSPIAEALDTAHEAGLIHRDIKPQNILVGARDHAFLADFGLTKGINDVGITKTGQFVGTVDYTSPEQIRGEKATACSDVYSLAAVLYECLTGVIPYPKPSDAAVMYAHLSEPPPLVTDERPDLVPALDDVVSRGMAKDPTARHETASELMEDAKRAFGKRVRAVITPPGPLERPEETGIREAEAKVPTRPSRTRTPSEVTGDAAPVTPEAPPAQAPPAEPAEPAAPGEPGPPAAPAEPDAERRPATAAPAGDETRTGRPPGETTRAGRPIAEPTRAGRPVGEPTRAGQPVEDQTRVEQPAGEPTRAGQPTPDTRATPAAAPDTRAAPAEAADTRAAPAEPPDTGERLTRPGAGQPTRAGSDTAERARSAPEPAAPVPPAERERERAPRPAREREPVRTPPPARKREPERAPPPAREREPVAARDREPPRGRFAPAEAGVSGTAARGRRGGPPSVSTKAPPRGGLAPVLGAVAAVAVVAAVAGYLLGRPDDEPAQRARPPAPLTNAGASGLLGFSYPANWGHARTPEIPGLRWDGELALGPRGRTGSGLTAGRTDSDHPSLLPAELRDRLPDDVRKGLGRPPPAEDRVKLGELEAIRYRDLEVDGFDDRRLHLYVAPTTAGVATLACYADSASMASVTASCDRVASTLRLVRGRPYRLGPDEDYAAALNRTLRRLNSERTPRRRTLADARRPNTQYQSAKALAAAYSRASRRIGGLRLSPQAEGANRSIAAALRSTATAYGRLARAARRSDQRGYTRQARAVRLGEAAFRRSLARLALLGYRAG